ncbi:hypothetical protein VTN77DRAFT_7521 [Rasamsonia byssochlamydoides]|uniref:uncharacterized protein n=1 Tax=Rasamsonia byssochlamydoides TaxID=89139 RepID=UPI003742D0B1
MQLSDAAVQKQPCAGYTPSRRDEYCSSGEVPTEQSSSSHHIQKQPNESCSSTDRRGWRVRGCVPPSSSMGQTKEIERVSLFHFHDFKTSSKIQLVLAWHIFEGNKNRYLMNWPNRSRALACRIALRRDAVDSESPVHTPWHIFGMTSLENNDIYLFKLYSNTSPCFSIGDGSRCIN